MKHEQEHEEITLQKSYQAHKDKTVVPSHLSDDILAHAKRIKASPWRWLNWQYALSLFVVVMLIKWIQPSQAPVKTHYSVSAQYKDDAVVYFHDIDLQYATTPKSKPSLNDQHYQQYLASLSLLENKSEMKGVVKQIDDGMIIEVCKLGDFQLSKQMVNQLLNNQSQPHMYVGSMVVIRTNSKGFIEEIESTNHAGQCPS